MGVEKGCDMYFNLLGLLNLGKRAFALFIGMVYLRAGFVSAHGTRSVSRFVSERGFRS